MPKLNQRGAIHLFATVIILAGIALGVFLSQNKTIWSPKASVGDNKKVKTLVWTHIYYNTLTEENIKKIAKAKFDGFMIESSGYQGVFDDFMNSGVARMKPEDFERFKSDVLRAVALSDNLGMDSLFIRLTAAETGYWDVFSDSDKDTILQTARSQAKFAKETGLKGIWLDMEPYNHANLWQQNLDPGKKAYQRKDQETGDRYFELGKLFMEGLLAEYPDIEVLFAPAFYADGMYTTYKFLPYFYAGMASVNPQKGIIRTTEASYGYFGARDISFVYGFENGLYNSYEDQSEDKNWVSVRQVIKDYDKKNGNSNLLTFFKTKSPLALSFWPQDLKQSREAVDNFIKALNFAREIAEKDPFTNPTISRYTWIYDGYGLLLKDEHNRCTVPDYDPAVSCYTQAAARNLGSTAPASTIPPAAIQLPSPSPTPVASFGIVLPSSPSPTPITTLNPGSEIKYIRATVSCFMDNLTPDQICKNKSFSRSVAVQGQYSAKGYWWKQCQGASIGNCQGLSCQTNQTDCTKVPDEWGNQQPYPIEYSKLATPGTVFNATELGYNCSGYNPGWTVVVACE